MKKIFENKWLSFLLVIIFIIIVVFFAVKEHKASKELMQNSVSFYCTEGILKASFGKENVSVLFPGGEVKNFKQSISADGARYESGNLIFWTKVNNAFVTKENDQVYSNCVTGEVSDVGGGKSSYTDPDNFFSFIYPNKFVLSGGYIGYSDNWKLNTTTLGILFTKVYIPKSYLPKTNFGDAMFTFGASADPDATKGCLRADNGGQVAEKNVMIGGTKFTKIISSDAGAGNYYETTSYRTLKDGECYALEYTIHSMDINNYASGQGIKEFDKNSVVNILDSIVTSFKFL